MKGRLTLVGAGPGDPDLISVKGIKALNKADVVLYDALIHPQLLKHADSAAKVFVGKRAGHHSFSQKDINNRILAEAISGKAVVRLKGGDPFIFGRGKEEIDFVETFGIETSVVPGISSVNLPGYYGIPLTVRGINESFWVVTGTTSDGTLSNDINLAAQSSATVVILMGLGKIKEITDIFSAMGKCSTAAAIISKGSLKEGKVIFGRVEEMAERSKDVEAPAIIVIGDAVETHPRFYERVKIIAKDLI